MFRSNYARALEDYKRARRRAATEELLARITGNRDQNELLPYETVRQQLQAIEKSAQRLEEIPLDAIVGSVGRYHDFTRKFLPKSSIDQGRWARVMASTQDLAGLPPIEVYQIGDAYFVKDGNHRVSVARQMGNATIQAYVTDVESKVNLQPDTTPDDLIIKSEQVNFLEKTQLKQLRPGADLSATKAGAYPRLLEHIAVHRYYLGLEQQREIPFEEAAANWYVNVFIPIVTLIQKRDLLRDFPDRTATDLYLWAADHRARLEEHLGWTVDPETALTDLSEKHGAGRRTFRRKINRLISRILPDNLESGPPPGTWRERLASLSVLHHLFYNIIVALDNSENTWHALEMAVLLSKLEKSRIHGIHIHPEKDPIDVSDHTSLEEEFLARCEQAGVSDYDFKVATGDIGRVLCEQSRFVDAILLPLNHPPGDKPIQLLSSGLITIIRNCPVPIFTVPISPRKITSVLLAYDGSIKAREALFISAYLGSQHGIRVKVLTSEDGLAKADQIQDEARGYLNRFPLESSYLISQQSVARAIADLHDQERFDLVMIGGYGGSILREVVLGSAVDQVLREIQLPILICR